MKYTYNRTFWQISRLSSFVKNVSEAKRVAMNLKEPEYCREINIPINTYNGWILNRTDSVSMIFKLAEQVPVDISIKYNDELIPVKTSEKFFNTVRRIARDYMKNNKLTHKLMAKRISVERSYLSHFLNDDRNSKPVSDRIMKLTGTKIIVSSPFSPEEGDAVRSKRLAQKIRRNKTEKIQSEVYVSEYKQEIKERLKKLWP